MCAVVRQAGTYRIQNYRNTGFFGDGQRFGNGVDKFVIKGSGIDYKGIGSGGHRRGIISGKGHNRCCAEKGGYSCTLIYGDKICDMMDHRMGFDHSLADGMQPGIKVIIRMNG